MSEMKQFDGSRRHVLDWVETPQFLTTIRAWVESQEFSIKDEPLWMPKSWANPVESKLFDPGSPYLTDPQKSLMQRWWLAHAGSANIPNWDIVVPATTTAGNPALLLVEAKAHNNEFDGRPKPRLKRPTPEAQKRTDENHEHVGRAINEAAQALALMHPGIHISRDHCYQLSNRIAMAWKLASMGIPNTLIFLGFTGDREIASDGKYFADDQHWQQSFSDYASSSFPLELLGQDVSCGQAPFRVLSRSLPVARLSRPIDERRKR